MSRIDVLARDMESLDLLASRDTPVRRLDPRAKAAVTAMFLGTVVSFGKYEIAEMTPLFLYPAAILALGQVPARVLFRYLLFASPFALLAGMFNPVLDRETAISLGALDVPGGWISFASIMLRFMLTVSAVLLLLACTGYVQVCAALGRLGAPRIVITQFLLLHRYMFILSDEAARMTRAHMLRSRDGRGPGIRVWASLAGHLLLHAHDRGSRTHSAMLARGFDGSLPSLRAFRWSWADTCFLAGCGGFFVLARFGNLAERLGDLMGFAV